MRRSRKALYKGYRWFVLAVEGSYEKKAALMIELSGSAGQIPDYDLVRRIWVPQMTTSAVATDGSIKEKQITALPGYLLVQAILTEPLYSALKKPDLPHVYGWLQLEDAWPSQIETFEVRNLAVLQNQIPEVPDFGFEVGDTVVVPSLGMNGEVLEIVSVCKY